MAHRLPHYLKQERRRSGLTQADIAALLGFTDRTNVKRHELRWHLPTIETALAYEIIFGKPVAELFSGIYANLRAELQARAKQQQEIVEGLANDSRSARRKRSLQRITSFS